MMQTANVVTIQSQFVDVAIVCKECGKTNNVRMPRAEYARLLLEPPTRESARSLTPNERNLIQHHVCPVCWDVMYGDN